MPHNPLLILIMAPDACLAAPVVDFGRNVIVNLGMIIVHNNPPRSPILIMKDPIQEFPKIRDPNIVP